MKWDLVQLYAEEGARELRGVIEQIEISSQFTLLPYEKPN